MSFIVQQHGLWLCPTPTNAQAAFISHHSVRVRRSGLYVGKPEHPTEKKKKINDK